MYEQTEIPPAASNFEETCFYKRLSFVGNNKLLIYPVSSLSFRPVSSWSIYVSRLAKILNNLSCSSVKFQS